MRSDTPSKWSSFFRKADCVNTLTISSKVASFSGDSSISFIPCRVNGHGRPAQHIQSTRTMMWRAFT